MTEAERYQINMMVYHSDQSIFFLEFLQSLWYNSLAIPNTVHSKLRDVILTK